MKEGWTLKKLGKVCDVSAGQGAPQGEENYCEDGIPFVKAGNVEELIHGLDERCIQKVNEEVAKTHRLKLYKAGSVVFAKSGMSCMKGLVYTLKNDCYVVSHLAVLTPKEVKSSFLNYALNYFKPNVLVKDEAYPSISLTDISNFTIPVPPIEIQSIIVNELDLLQSIKDKQKAQLKELNNLAQAVFYDMFGNPVENDKEWKTDVLKTVAPQKKYDGIIPSKNGLYWLLNLDMVEQQTGRVIEKVFTKENEIGNSTITFDTSNVLYSKLRPYLNKVVVPDEIGYGTSELVPLRPNPKLLNRFFLAYLLKSKSFVDYISGKVAGAKMPRVSMDVFRGFSVILPPLSLQQSFATKIESIEKQKAAIDKSIEETRKLFDYTMDKYFG